MPGKFTVEDKCALCDSAIALETIRLNCSQATVEAGTLNIRFDDAALGEGVTFSISQEIAAVNGGAAFARILEVQRSAHFSFHCDAY